MDTYEKNLTMLTDYYQLTMMQGYFLNGMHRRQVVCDFFFRKTPDGNGFAIACGLASFIDYVRGLHFTEEDIAYLGGMGQFRQEFLDYLRHFRFTGEVLAVPEGTVVFPMEPLIRVKAPIIEAQMLETTLLNIMNHQTLIATKASRICMAAMGDPVLEFGLRRAQGPDAGVYGARAAVIGGCVATSNVMAGKMFGLPVRGTHGHSWVMSFPRDIDALREYARLYPSPCILLVDTYDTLRQGVPHAIRVFEEMRSEGRLGASYGIRLDSGDFAYISKRARVMLDGAGFPEAIISASSDMDENLIKDLKLQGARIDLWGVGTNLITSKDSPALGGVYKIAAQEDENGIMQPRIKVSDNYEKITNPGVKLIYRIYDKATGKMKADMIVLEGEELDESQDLRLIHPISAWKRMMLKGGKYRVRKLLVPVFIGGECVYKTPKIDEIREYCAQELDTLWDEYKRLVYPEIMPVDLSTGLHSLKEHMIREVWALDRD